MSTVPAYLERVVAWASGPERQGEILAARTAWFARTGEAHEDDRSYEQRIAGFLEHYLFEHTLPDLGKPPVRAFADTPGLSELEARIYREMSGSQHGVFEVRKLRARKGLVLRELVTGTDYEVAQDPPLPGVDKGDILEARLVPFAGELRFTSAFLFHPREARKVILREARRRRKKEPRASAERFAEELARLHLKRERYRTAQVEQIYRFD